MRNSPLDLIAHYMKKKTSSQRKKKKKKEEKEKKGDPQKGGETNAILDFTLLSWLMS